MRILIAEDDLVSRTALAGILERSGYDVVSTVNGVEAWEELQKPNAPKLAILDWKMPEMNGADVVRLVRAKPAERPTYIIMLTGMDRKSDIVTGLQIGANDYLSKPFDTGELRARIEVGCRMLEMQEDLLKSHETVLYQASHDSLTGMWNRRAILERLNAEISRTNRSGDSLTIGICDIDNFKRVNDSHGHQTGDDVLCELALILIECLRKYDVAGRIGGEEFLLITPMNDSPDVTAVYERLCAKVAETSFVTRSGHLSITVSIGVVKGWPGNTADELLAAADEAMYRAKAQGRNRMTYAVLPSS